MRRDPAGRGAARSSSTRPTGAWSSSSRTRSSRSPSAARARTCASPRSSRAGSSTSSARPSSSRWRRRRSPPLQQIDGVTEAIARSMYRLGFRALEELAEASERGARGDPGPRRRRGGRRRIKDAAPRRRWSASARSASSAASSRTEPLTERERLLFIRGVGERTVAAPRGGRLQDGRGHPPRGRGQARDQDGPRHQEGARHQAGRRALPVERVEGRSRRRAAKPRPSAPRGGRADADGRLRTRDVDRGEDEERTSNVATPIEPASQRAQGRSARREPSADAHVRRLRPARRRRGARAPRRRRRTSVAFDLAGRRVRSRRARPRPSRLHREGAREGSRAAFTRRGQGRLPAAHRPSGSSSACDRRMAGLLLAARRSRVVAAGADAALEALEQGAPLAIVAVDAGGIADTAEVQRCSRRAGAPSPGRRKASSGTCLASDSVAICAVRHAGIAGRAEEDASRRGCGRRDEIGDDERRCGMQQISGGSMSGKVRVYEVAKQLNLDPKQVVGAVSGDRRRRTCATT